MELVIGFVVVLLVVYAASHVMEALRRRPVVPAALYWDEHIAIDYATINGHNIRYIEHGNGPPLLLLHTLRTQLDIFEKIIPELSKTHTVYALDYPGHGFSDIIDEEYEPELFLDYVDKFMIQHHLEDATVAGVSIGGTIALLLAARNNPRVGRVIAINPYDYGKGLGVARGNAVAFLVMRTAVIPVIGEMFMRLRLPVLERIIMTGGVTDPASLTAGFLSQLLDSGMRKDHYRKFINLLRNAWKWDEAHKEYGNIRVPVLVIYGSGDWAHAEERQRTINGIPGAQSMTIDNGGHFLSMDRPVELTRAITDFIPAN